ncbi:MAG: pentapeptide repeat-containing protein, partial [Thermodesulfobacteriota bacterium]
MKKSTINFRIIAYCLIMFFLSGGCGQRLQTDETRHLSENEMPEADSSEDRPAEKNSTKTTWYSFLLPAADSNKDAASKKTGAAIRPLKAKVARLLDENKCVNCDLKGEDLAGSDLDGADLENVTLKDADLSGASLTESNLSGADL